MDTQNKEPPLNIVIHSFLFHYVIFSLSSTSTVYTVVFIQIKERKKERIHKYLYLYLYHMALKEKGRMS